MLRFCPIAVVMTPIPSLMDVISAIACVAIMPAAGICGIYICGGGIGMPYG
jgi:hypothetical protein